MEHPEKDFSPNHSLKALGKDDFWMFLFILAQQK